MPGQTVESFFEDSEHNLWVGLFDSGLVQLRDGKFMTFGKAEGLSSNIEWCGLQARDRSIWMATSTGGLDRILPNGVVRIYTMVNGGRTKPSIPCCRPAMGRFGWGSGTVC